MSAITRIPELRYNGSMRRQTRNLVHQRKGESCRRVVERDSICIQGAGYDCEGEDSFLNDPSSGQPRTVANARPANIDCEHPTSIYIA